MLVIPAQSISSRSRRFRLPPQERYSAGPEPFPPGNSSASRHSAVTCWRWWADFLPLGQAAFHLPAWLNPNCRAPGQLQQALCQGMLTQQVQYASRRQRCGLAALQPSAYYFSNASQPTLLRDGVCSPSPAQNSGILRMAARQGGLGAAASLYQPQSIQLPVQPSQSRHNL